MPETLSFSAPLIEVAVTPYVRGPQSYEERVREGERAMREAMLAQRVEVARLGQEVLQAMQSAVSQLVRESEQSLVDLALVVAQRLVAGVPITREQVEGAMREALQQLDHAGECEVLLHPEDLLLLDSGSAEGAVSPGGLHVRLRGSEEVSRGGCLVRTRFGILDAQRETKMRLLQRGLQA